MEKIEVKDLWSDYWDNTAGSKPIEVIDHKDDSQEYEMHAAHIFKLENGQYCLVTETGCSCYSSYDAAIDLFPTEAAARKSFNQFFKKDWLDE